jgi:outer membrane cobalamin receptor
MARPSYFDLVPAVDRSDNSQTQGNAGLLPARSTNVDVQYEYSPNLSERFTIGYYHKTIIDPLEDEFGSVGLVFVTTKGNGDPAKVDGLEAQVAKQFGDFGISANYSYVHSEISSVKKTPRLDVWGDLVFPIASFRQLRPLASQSPHIANATLSYQNERWGTGVNLAFNYTGRRLIAVADVDGYDTYEDGIAELDFSAEQGLFSKLRLNLKLMNLLNSETVIEVPSGDVIRHPSIVIERDLNKMRGYIGIVYQY